MAKSRKAELSGYLEYIDDYDRKARGEDLTKMLIVSADLMSVTCTMLVMSLVLTSTLLLKILDYADRVEGKTRRAQLKTHSMHSVLYLKAKAAILHLLNLKKTPTLLWKKHLRTASHLR